MIGGRAFDKSMECKEIQSKVNRYFTFQIGGQNPYRSATNNFFFQSVEFLANQGIFSFYILDNKLKKCEGLFHISIQEEIGYSPLKAPFGSIDISETISPSILNEFLGIVLNWCRENDLKALKIKHYPHCYDPEGSVLVQNALFNNGFLISDSDVGQYINLYPASHAFNRSVLIKIKKCKRAGLKVQRLDKSKIKEVYELLKTCKDRKGYPTNMSLEELEHSVSRFSEHYLIFGVTDNEKLISASICVVVNNEILYDFSHGHVWEYDKFSPVTLLIEGILDFCLSSNYKILDLGLSTSNSSINIGLFDFKRRLGCFPTIKLSYLKNFN